MIRDRHWRWVARAALILYCLWSVLLIAQRPGVHYDEALLVLGAVHMRHAPTELALPHDPDTWSCVRGRCFPLMTVRYVGAVKEYLCLPVFAIFGASAEAIRFVSMLMGVLGIWGIARLVAVTSGELAGAITALAIAINPAYINITTFDNGTVCVWMAAMGLLCLAVAKYLRDRSVRNAFWIGAAMGFGVWGRANFIWLVIAVVAAALLVLRREILQRWSHWIAWAAGGVVGGLPFLVYQIQSRGGTWEALDMFVAGGTFGERLMPRLVLFAETFLTDREHRVMWNGPMMPDWQRWLFPLIAIAACAVCLIVGKRFARIVAIVAAILSIQLLTTRLQISEHHLIAVIPLAILLTVLACSLAPRIGWAIAVLYAGCALYWQIGAIEGLHRIGGAGAWSDAMYRLTDQLQKHPLGTIKLLDWGLQDNFYVISDGRIPMREIFPEGAHRPWIDEIREGGAFVINGAANRQFPAPSEEFLRTLAETRPHAKRQRFTQHDGVVAMELIEIEPNTIGAAPAHQHSITRISMEDAARLDGFYEMENGSRWTKREFAITFELPAPGYAPVIAVQLYIPDALIQKLGPIALTARLRDHRLEPETFRRPGQYTFKREFPGDWLAIGTNRVEFVLDKALLPTPTDRRELGVVVLSASLEM